MRAHLLLAATTATLTLAACGHDGEECGAHSHDPACLVCTGAEQPLTPGTVLTVPNGYTVELVTATPDPFVEGNNELTVRVRKDGAPAAAVDFTGTDTWYPNGGHGSPLRPTVTPGATAGDYTLTQINFLHAGSWELRFMLGGTADPATYALPVCVEEAPGA